MTAFQTPTLGFAFVCKKWIQIMQSVKRPIFRHKNQPPITKTSNKTKWLFSRSFGCNTVTNTCTDIPINSIVLTASRGGKRQNKPITLPKSFTISSESLLSFYEVFICFRIKF